MYKCEYFDIKRFEPRVVEGVTTEVYINDDDDDLPAQYFTGSIIPKADFLKTYSSAWYGNDYIMFFHGNCLAMCTPLKALIAQYNLPMGLSKEEYLALIEKTENDRLLQQEEEQRIAAEKANEPTPEERMAAAMEFQNLMSL